MERQKVKRLYITEGRRQQRLFNTRDVNADERPKKKRKNRTGFADPRKDGSLGSQSQKGE